MYDHKDGIRLRKLHKGDLHALLGLKQESWWGTHGTLVVNLDDQVRWYENISQNELFMAAEKLWSGTEQQPNYKLIGVACYTDIDWYSRTLNISGSVLKENRQDHLVKPAFSAGLDFAFEILNMQRVGAEVLESNPAAQALEIGHLGFVVEGRRRRAVYKSGRYYDSIQLGLLREEWEVQERVKAYEGICNKNFDHVLAEKAALRFRRRENERDRTT